MYSGPKGNEVLPSGYLASNVSLNHFSDLFYFTVGNVIRLIGDFAINEFNVHSLIKNWKIC